VAVQPTVYRPGSNTCAASRAPRQGTAAESGRKPELDFIGFNLKPGRMLGMRRHAIPLARTHPDNLPAQRQYEFSACYQAMIIGVVCGSITVLAG
jgi:hypothetical protein